MPSYVARPHVLADEFVPGYLGDSFGLFPFVHGDPLANQFDGPFLVRLIRKEVTHIFGFPFGIESRDPDIPSCWHSGTMRRSCCWSILSHNQADPLPTNDTPASDIPQRFQCPASDEKAHPYFGMDHDAVLALRSSGPAYSSVGGGCVKRAGGTWERPTGARRWLCARVSPASPPPPIGHPRNKRRMEVRSAPGLAITRAGGIKPPKEAPRSCRCADLPTNLPKRGALIASWSSH